MLVFGGNGTISKKKATRICGTAERLVGLKLGDDCSAYTHVDVLGFYYNPSDKNPRVGEFTQSQRGKIAQNIFVKLCYDEKGNLLPADKMQKRFSTINIVTHCLGAYELCYIGIFAARQMKRLGYSEEEVQKAFDQVFHLSYAPYCEHSCFPMLRINSFIDGQFRGMRRKYINAYGKELRGVALYYDGAGYFMGKPASMSKVPILSLYSSQLLNTKANSNIRNLQDEHGIERLERDYDWTQGHQSGNAKNANLVSKFAGLCLAEAMAVSIRNTMTEKLITKPELKSLMPVFQTLKSDYSDADLEPSI